MVDEIWQRLLERAGSRPGLVLTDEPDLHLLVDGRRLDPADRRGDQYSFRLTGRPREVRLVSRSGVPQELGTARDPRELGVAVSRLMLALKSGQTRALEADDERLSHGYHAFEPNNGVRWTDGDAIVPAALFTGMTGPGMLIVSLHGAMRYAATSAIQRVA